MDSWGSWRRNSRRGLLSGRLRGEVDLEAFDALGFGVEDSIADAAVVEGGAFLGDSAEGGQGETAEGFVAGVIGERESALLVGLIDGESSIGLEGGVGEAFEHSGGVGFVFVADFADEFFEDVFDGDESRGGAVLIEDDGDVDFL